MTNKRIAVVTGASSGIGLWIARGLLEQSYTVLLVCRDAGRGRAAQGWLAQMVPNGVTELLLTDLSRQAEVRRVAAAIRQRTDRLALLVNNAGCLSPRFTLTEDGVETTLAVNYLAPFLLTQELLPLLQAYGAAESASARIVNVGSASADHARFNLDHLRTPRPRLMLSAYAESKLALLMYSIEEARRQAGRNVTVNCVHPGMVATRIGLVGGLTGFFWRCLTPFVLTPEQGARCPLTVANAPEWATRTGLYAKRGQPARPNSRVHDAANTKALFELSTALTIPARAKIN